MSDLFDIPVLPAGTDIRDIRPWLNQLRSALLAARIVRSDGVRRRVTAGGTTLHALSGGFGSSFTPPLWLYQSGAASVRVAPGTVGGISPTDVDTDLDLSSFNGTWHIYLDATLNAAGDVTAVEIGTSTSAVPSDDSDHAYYPIGTAVVAASVVTSVSPTLAWSQEFAACGRDSADPATTPGTYSFYVA